METTKKVSSSPFYSIIEVSTSTHDTEWDDFILEIKDGHYTQTSLWSEIKCVQGWSPLRIVFKDSKGIVAGAQILSRKLPIIGKVGYISKGPVLRSYEKAFVQDTIKSLFNICRKQGFFYLCIQPSNEGGALVDYFKMKGLQRSLQGDLEKPGTLVLDLTRDVVGIRAQIKPKRRRSLSYAEKHGCKFREGTREDLSTFFKLHMNTGERSEFDIQSEAFFNKLWDEFAPRGYLHLFLLEFNEQPITAELAITYKDTFEGYRLGWSGQHNDKHPNECMMWNTILWAKEHGCSKYDLGGIETKAAKAVLQGDPKPTEIKGTYTEYKLRFTEQVVLYPESYEKLFNKPLSFINSIIHSVPIAKKAVKTIYNILKR